VHIQLNLPDLRTAVINNTVEPLANLIVRTRVFALDGKLVADRSEKVSVGANTTAEGSALPDTGSAVVFVKLELRDARGELLSENLYWQAAHPDGFRQLSDMAPMNVLVSATRQSVKDSARVTVTLSNRGEQVAVMNKVTLRLASTGARVLPAYASDNYIGLLPGETRQIVIECPASAAAGNLQVGLTGWNTRSAKADVPAM
jgi:hypothetical protein